MLAYRRELRAKRREGQWIMRLFGPLNRRGLGGQAAILLLLIEDLRRAVDARGRDALGDDHLAPRRRRP